MTPSNELPFGFDINFSFGADSVFMDVLEEFDGINPPPPVSGYFLLLQGDPMLLLDGTNFDLL